MIKTALIFAAGRGERMMPFTQYTPKPMLQVGKQPLLAFNIQKLSQAGIQHIIINHAHMGAKIRQYFGNGNSLGVDIQYLPEPPGGLETGGTLAFIRNFLSAEDEILFCMNGDIYTDYVPTFDIHFPPQTQGHLVLIPIQENLPPGNFGLDSETKQIIDHQRNYIFSGLAFYQCAALQELQFGRYSIRHWLIQKAKEKRLTGEIYNGLWCDIGTPTAWDYINQKLALK
jgi:N-acetyl-alpha-D-muramate 1-phosphate uridylyltransferase